MSRTIFLLIFSMVFFAFKADKPMYILYKKDGKSLKYQKMIKKLSEADVIFFGELHNNPVSHWLQLQLLKDLKSEQGMPLVLGAEMFEADNQLILDEYVFGKIKESKFESDARLWPNYKTDYKPLVNFARDNEIKFVATNIPRRYASVVFSEGFDGLESFSNEAKKFFHPLPIPYDENLPCYQGMLEMGGGAMGGMHSNNNFPKAQAVKDATMAYFIEKNLKDNSIFVHFNGAYHSDNFEGIVWYLKNMNSELKIATISTVQQNSIEELDSLNLNIADYVICVPEDMVTSY